MKHFHHVMLGSYINKMLLTSTKNECVASCIKDLKNQIKVRREIKIRRYSSIRHLILKDMSSPFRNKKLTPKILQYRRDIKSGKTIPE